jgi:hypothetical protein
MGDTRLPLNAVIAGQKCNTKMGETSKSKIAEHFWDEDHRIHRNKAEIIHKEENRITRKLGVTVYIRTTEQVIN